MCFEVICYFKVEETMRVEVVDERNKAVVEARLIFERRRDWFLIR